MDSSSQPRWLRLADMPLYCFWLAALLYVLNVLLGKFSTPLPSFAGSLALGDLGQFVLLLLVSIFLVAAALIREAERQANGKGATTDNDNGKP